MAYARGLTSAEGYRRARSIRPTRAGAPAGPGLAPRGPMASADSDILSYEQPVVDPQVSQRMHVPLRTREKWPQTGQGSPS